MIKALPPAIKLILEITETLDLRGIFLTGFSLEKLRLSIKETTLKQQETMAGRRTLLGTSTTMHVFIFQKSDTYSILTILVLKRKTK